MASPMSYPQVGVSPGDGPGRRSRTAGDAADDDERTGVPRHRRIEARRPGRGPYLIIVGVLAAAMIAGWTLIALRGPDHAPVACGRPETGLTVASTRLIGEAVAPPAEVPVRVLNANGEAGEATAVAEQLAELGFGRHPEEAAGNDPVIAAQDLDCHGQLRFGADAIGRAGTLHLVLPCFELVQDRRIDGTVDVALGRGFDGLDDSAPVRAVLEALNAGEEPDPALTRDLPAATC